MIDASLYAELDSAISMSKFWEFPNSPGDDDNLITIKGLGYQLLQTPAAKMLQKSLNEAIKNRITNVIFYVGILDDESAIITPSHPAYPNKIVLGAEASVNSANQTVIVITIGTFGENFDMSLIDSSQVSSKAAAVIRHELIHDSQYRSISKNTGNKPYDAYRMIQNDPRAISNPSNDKYSLDKNNDNLLYSRDYRSSYIEIEAHAHDTADLLLHNVNGDVKKAMSIITHANENLDNLIMPETAREYMEFFPGTGNKTRKIFFKKVFEYLEILGKTSVGK